MPHALFFRTPVILVYAHNALPTLPALLRRLAPHSPDSPLVVINDASTDGSDELLRTLQAEGRLDLLSLHTTPHRTQALNAGFAYVLRTYPGRDVLRLHADTLPEPGADGVAAHMAAALYAVPECGVLGVRLITADGMILEQGRRIVSGLGLHAPDRRLLHMTPDTTTLAIPDPPLSHDVDAVSGACALYSHALLETLLRASGSVLDETYGPKGTEDDDLCFAARAQGFTVRVAPGIRAVYTGLTPPPEGAQAPELTRRLRREKTLLEAQAEYWTHKWGWDPLLPDLGTVRRLYGRTPVCWRMGESLRFMTDNTLPAVDLCMATWNGEAVLPRCLESLAATDYPADRLTLYIIDNASTDGSPELLHRFAETCPFPVRVERLHINTGAVAALNWAFALGSAPLTAKLDDDIVVPPDWLRKLADVFRLRPWAGVTGPCVVDDSPARLVQCADFTYHPTAFSHDMEPEILQWAGLARVTHVRGCCNLYRRDVFARCGMLDLGYSPSQWDDPDHHMALLHEGYEVIYAGHVCVAHKCVLRHRASTTSLINGAMHKARMLAKWGADSPELLECALLFSAEGRFLNLTPVSDDAKISPPRTPESALALSVQKPSPELVRHIAARCKTILENEGGLSPTLPALAGQLREAARRSLAAGNPAQALGELRTALCCGAGDAGFAPTLHALADILEQLGAPNPELRSRAALFGPRPATAPSAVPIFTSHSQPIALTATRHAAFCVPHALRHDHDLHALLLDYARELASHDIAVTLHAGPVPLPDADVVHFWTLDHPHETLRHARYLRNARPSLPLVLSPLWRADANPGTVSRLAAQVRQGLEADSVVPPAPEQEGDAPLIRRRVLELMHAVLTTGTHEVEGLRLPQNTPRLPLPGLALPGVDPAAVQPDAFTRESGVHGHVLTIAPFHPAANQAFLLAALTALETQKTLPVVLVGEARERWYLYACRRLAPRALFVDDMAPDLLASALSGAAVLALPSLEHDWSTATRAAVTAQAFGIPVVAAHGSPAADLPGVIGCDPLSVPSLVQALRRALEQRTVKQSAVENASHTALDQSHSCGAILAAAYANQYC